MSPSVPQRRCSNDLNAERHRRAPARLGSVLLVTFLASVSGGAFWAGIFFVTAQHYRFSTAGNLALAGAMGLVYAAFARFTGALSRALQRSFTPRAVLAGALAIWGLASLVPLAARSSPGWLWLTALVGAATSAMTWPLLESFLSAGRHGAGMRAAIGWFNVTWTPATAVPLLLLPLFARQDILWTVAISALTNAGALLALVFLPAHPAPHGQEAAAASVGREYVWLLRTASWLLPLSYLMSATLSPVLPHRLAEVGGIRPAQRGRRHLDVGPLHRPVFHVARPPVARPLGHPGRRRRRPQRRPRPGFRGADASGVVAGLFLFGAGMGITYYAALYYSLAVGHAAVDAGGTFEALIGLGYFVGPLIGLAGEGLVGGPAGSATVALTWLTAGCVALPALRPYLQARRQRIGTSGPPRC